MVNIRWSSVCFQLNRAHIGQWQSCETRWRNYARASFKFRHDNRWSLNDDGPKRNTSLTLLLIQLNGWTIRSALLVHPTRIQFFLFSVNWSAPFEFPENQLYPLSYGLFKFCFLKFVTRFPFSNFWKKFKQIILTKYCIIHYSKKVANIKLNK